MKVVLSNAARSDIDEITRYIFADSPTRALSFADELLDRCGELAEFPRAYPLVPRYGRLGVRRRVHRNYLIFYRIAANQIEVLRILHGARDYEALLFSDE